MFYIILWIKPLKTWFTHHMWTYNVCMLMKSISLYKGVILTIQDKCPNCIKGVQDYYLWKISIDVGQLFFLVLQSKNYTLLWHIFLYHTLISCTLSNSHMTIQILISLMMFEGKLCFPFSTIFWTKSMETWLTYLWTHVE